MSGSSLFDVDKTELLELVLERYGARFRPGHSGWQSIHCINADGHPAGDRNPSASINLVFGYYWCFACGIQGDGFDLMRELEGVEPRDVPDALGGDLVARERESGYLF